MPAQLLGRLLGLPAYRDKTTAFVLTAQQTIYRAIIVLLTITALLWMAVFLYVAFYYSYMPAISHTRPVHLQYSSCGRDPGLCSYPTANVTLTRRQQLLMIGQPYRVLLELEMPESYRNREAGMFMVCLQLKDNLRMTLGDRVCRSTMLPYRSPLLQSMMTFFMAPLLISGSAEEKQVVGVEVYQNFEEIAGRPVTEAVVQVESQHVEVYRVWLRIHAHFTGLRYFMWHWPVASAAVGIMTNLVFLGVIAAMSWWKWMQPRQVVMHVGYDGGAARRMEERRIQAKERLMRERSKLVKREEDEVEGGKEEEKGRGKEELEKPKEEKEGYQVIGRKGEGKGGAVEVKKEGKEVEEEEGEEEEDGGDLGEDEEFSELDPESSSTGVGGGGDADKCKVEEDNKENIPEGKGQGELRKRKGAGAGNGGSGEETEEKQGRESNC